MDFFASQDAARRKTSLLVGYFASAVVLMIAAIYLVVVLVFSFAGGRQAEAADFWQPDLLLLTALIMTSIITLGSLYKTIELRAGGESIAAALGGQRIRSNTTDLAERTLLNVVEETALASGVPAPPVFVLSREAGINAFAAGFTPSDAVIGVSRGALDYLSRDELQGVIAHEFSHILNGDMRLNLRLIGILHGILLIAIVGYYAMRFGGHTGGSSRRDGKGGGGAAAVVILGVAALVIGYIGLFFARLIKAAVARQREYLADASSVQFTRNPDGISGALKKIGGLAAGSRIETPEAETASHMFFGNVAKFQFFNAFATHPPLVDRIQRIDPRFDGEFPKTVRPRREAAPAAPPERKPPRRAGFNLGVPGGPWKAAERIPLDPLLVMAGIGSPSTKHFQYAADLVAAMPQTLVDAIHDPCDSRAVVFAMLLDEDEATRDQQRRLLQTREGASTELKTVGLAPLVKEQGAAARLPIIEMLQNVLGAMSPEQYANFRESVIELVKADEQVTLFEFFLQRVLLTALDRRFFATKAPAVRYFDWSALSQETADLISALAHLGQSDEDQARQAFQRAALSLAPPQDLTLRPRGECTLTRIDEALTKLAEASPTIKKQLLSALIVCVAADGQVTVAEAELLRAVADSLGCPIPPIVAGPASELDRVAQDPA